MGVRAPLPLLLIETSKFLFYKSFGVFCSIQSGKLIIRNSIQDDKLNLENNKKYVL